MSKDNNLFPADRDARVMQLYEELLEIEQRLIPTGLHILGRPSAISEKTGLLKMIASFDRREFGARALPDLITDGVGDDQEKVDAVLNRAIVDLIENGVDSAAESLAGEANVTPESSRPMFTLLADVSTSLQSNHELDSVVRALRGEFIEPGPGSDIVQNPSILPTGRNTHAINPYAVPSDVAFARGEVVAKNLLDRYREEKGRYPETMALVLWGLDNIKTQGEGVAQALWLLGVRPVRDGLNRTTSVEAIPLEELGRPRIDLVMTVSGIFRDLFSPTVQLLDKSVRLVAKLDEPDDLNFVRKHVNEQMTNEQCEMDEAAIRVFSNAPGNYGTNVNFMVMDSQWERAEMLGDLFVTRKCFAYGRDSKGRPIEGSEARMAMERALSRVEATYQNIDTFEIGLTDVDHYFEYLGGISKAVEKRARARPSIYLSDSLSRDSKIRSLEETVRLETRAKTLNPKWYEGMLKHGFRGVAEIENHVANTFGWSATADAVDDWIYSEVAKTFLFDESMLERLRDLNPHSAHSLVRRLLEANGRGYWDVEQSVLDKLREISRSLEDQLEGVA
ncbi:MAG TPA: cobaltochelatase subunit CobN [Pyrinomonadaceae bacterium]|jgi:magnesium chelatase subunit H|nr:cobaltochelatase subunit CobN [Pyrinomonadaceae bacterium]